MSLICYQDMLDSATRTYSSQDTSFPASNLYDQSIRGRVWRSAGYFNITSANKGIVFQTTVGVDVTANIAEAEYTSITSFLAAVVTALNAASAGTYTATQDTTTKKIILTKSTGTFRLMCTNAGFTAADVLGFDTAADRTGALTYTADYIRIHTSERLTWDLGASSNPDAFIAIGKKGTAIKISESATIKLQGSTTSSFASPAYDQTLTYGELAIIKLKTSTDSGLHTAALRYWSLYIVDKDNANGYVELSNVFLGDYYKPTTGKIQFPLTYNGQDFSTDSQFKSGSKSYARRGRTVNFNFNWFPLTTTEKEVFENIEYDLGRSKPFYLVMDPDLYFGSSIEHNTKYVRFTNGLGLSFERPNLWTSSWSVEECL